MSKWVAVKDRKPDTREPVVYARPAGKEWTPLRWHVGIAYWTVSNKWNPEQESEACPQGYTHWMPLPPPPEDENDG